MFNFDLWCSLIMKSVRAFWVKTGKTLRTKPSQIKLRLDDKKKNRSIKLASGIVINVFYWSKWLQQPSYGHNDRLWSERSNNLVMVTTTGCGHNDSTIWLWSQRRPVLDEHLQYVSVKALSTLQIRYTFGKYIAQRTLSWFLRHEDKNCIVNAMFFGRRENIIEAVNYYFFLGLLYVVHITLHHSFSGSLNFAYNTIQNE